MKHITTNELMRISSERLVLQGCGGDPLDWLNGINEMLTEAGILRDGSTFTDISIFEHEGNTNILFNMENVNLDTGKLAMWRLQTHGTFGGTWLSDYLPNQLGVEMGEFEQSPEPVAAVTRLTVSNSDNRIPVLSACFENTEEENGVRWLSFPAATESVQAVLKELGIYSGNVLAGRYESGVKHLADCLGAATQPDNLDELNYLAAKLEGLSETQHGSLEAALESRRHCGSVKDIINLTENLDLFYLQPARTPGMYGDFLLDMAKDDTSGVFRRLEDSRDPDERALAQYILELEAHVDEVAYGRAAAEAENGVFTEYGYLTEAEGFKEVYSGPEDIPAEYRVFAYPEPRQYFKTEPADLAAFVYKIHALAGDYMADAHFNVSTLAGGSEYYLMLMNGKNIYICEMGNAYHSDATANDIWFHQAVTPDTMSFMLHVTDRNGDRISGRITVIDHAEQREDIITHGVGFMHINATLKDGTERTYTKEEWAALPPIDRDRVESWERRYDMNGVDNLVSHLNELCARLEYSANHVPPEFILEELNSVFTEDVAAGRPDLFRIAHAAARELTARGDAPVYRLLPDKDELLTPLDAVRNGSNFTAQNTFAIKSVNIDGFLKWAERGAGDIIRRTANRDEREKPKTYDAEH